MDKIAVIGANQTGLAFAYFAAKAGFRVSVYEAKAADGVAYNWTDDMVPETFEQVGLPMPPKSIYTRKRSWTFVPPQKGAYITVELPEKELDISIYRRPLNKWLLNLAEEAGVKVHYEKPVKKLIVKSNIAVGVMLSDGEAVEASLVVDCGGVNSCVRTSLPTSMGIQRQVKATDTFFVRRTFFERPEGTARPEKTNKAYLKHKNENGISWCLLSHDENEADVLIGRLGELKDETYQNALADLREENEIIGERVTKGGELLQIPVRRPLPLLVADGYALLGDSACMTIPMLGSGMASGMKAGRMLADVISRPVYNRFAKENLYDYQRLFMEQIGAKHAAVDMMKNWLLASGEGDLDFLLGHGVISKNVLKQASAGEMLRMSPSDLVTAGVNGVIRPQLMFELVELIARMNAQYKVAASLPKKYDEKALWYWQRQYEAAYK